MSGIEASCSGAKLYIPKDFFGKTCIKSDLLDNDISYAILTRKQNSFYNQFVYDIKHGVNKEKNHIRFCKSTHTWKHAAEVIRKALV